MPDLKDPLEEDSLSSIPPLQPGDRIAHFVIRRLIDQGGFGYVFDAFDERLERRVALKIPRAKEFTERQRGVFMREAKLTAKLRHPNIVTVLEVGEFKGRVWIASDFIDGQNLSRILLQKRLDFRNVARVSAAIADGIQAAHEKQIYHLDLKPGNIMLDKKGAVYITDFGLAIRDEPSPDAPLQFLGPAGTIPYMSPEQLDPRGNIDGRSDVYAIGIIMYQMLTGERPFKGSRSELAMLIAEGRAKRPSALRSEIPRALEAICLKAMHVNADCRYQAAAELKEELASWAAGTPVGAYQPNLRVRAIEWVARRWRSVALAALIALLSTAATTALWLTFYRPAPADPLKNSADTILHKVVVTTNPLGYRIAVARIDPTTGGIDESQVLHPKLDPSFTLELQPGYYIVEAVNDQGMVQQVMRYVPTRLVQQLTTNVDRRCATARVDSQNRVLWPAIDINVVDNYRDAMVNVAGGSFNAGSDVLTGFPMTQVDVPTFWLSAHEVTVREYQRIMGSLPQRMTLRLGQAMDADQPVTNVDFLDACEFAERVGLRLPTLDELLFASTNRGTTRFPWGDSSDMIESWPIDIPQPPAFDVTVDPAGIHGLYSRVAEWTESGMPGATLIIPALENSTGPSNGSPFPRMIAACMPELLLGRPDVSFMRRSCRLFVSEQLTPAHSDGLGFRCARSEHPRLLQNSE